MITIKSTTPKLYMSLFTFKRSELAFSGSVQLLRCGKKKGAKEIFRNNCEMPVQYVQ